MLLLSTMNRIITVFPQHIFTHNLVKIIFLLILFVLLLKFIQQEAIEHKAIDKSS